MAAFNKFNQFVEDLAHKVHDFNADAFTLFLTNSAPVATNTILANITEVSYTNLSSRVLATTTKSQTSGTYTLLFTDHVLTSSGGTTGPFRYVGIYNDTPTSPADPLIGWYDYGSSITLNDGETLTVDWTGSTFTIA